MLINFWAYVIFWAPEATEWGSLRWSAMGTSACVILLPYNYVAIASYKFNSTGDCVMQKAESLITKSNVILSRKMSQITARFEERQYTNAGFAAKLDKE